MWAWSEEGVPRWMGVIGRVRWAWPGRREHLDGGASRVGGGPYRKGAWPVFEGVASGDRYHSGRPCSWDGTGAPSFCWKETGSGKRVGISRIAQAESKAFSFLGFDFFSLLGRASWKRLRDASRRPQETRISPSAGWFRPVLAPATDGGAGGK